MTTQSNGKPNIPGMRPNTSPVTNLDQLSELLHNVTSLRAGFFNSIMDPRRDINDECGYPPWNTDNVRLYKELFDREPLANRATRIMSKETWQMTPSVYEDNDNTTQTAFEKDWDELSKSLSPIKSWFRDEKGASVWEYLQRVDEISGIGHFGVLLLGIDDGLPLNQPVDGFVKSNTRTGVTITGPNQSSTLGTDAQYYDYPGNVFGGEVVSDTPSSKRRKLLYIRCFDESLVQITRYETNEFSSRYGQPVMYRITMSDPQFVTTGIGQQNTTRDIHWSRVIHVVDNKTTSEVMGVPRQQPILNPLLDTRKVRGGSAEMYWRGAFPGLSLETNPQLGGEVTVDATATKDMMEQYMNGLQRYLLMTGMTAKTLAPQVVDPKGQLEAQVEAICIQLGIPVRIFKGSERGELSSGQDEGDFNDKLRHRQNFFVTPQIIVPFVDRLIMFGVLSEPKQGFGVEWPDLDSLTDAEKSDISLKKSQSLATYVQSGAESYLPPFDYFTRFVGMDEAEVNAILDNASKLAEEQAEPSLTSPLIGSPEGIAGLVSLFQLASQGGMSQEQLKQSLMILFKMPEDKADDIIADGVEISPMNDPMQQAAAKAQFPPEPGPNDTNTTAQ